VELVKFQERVKLARLKVCIVFEGCDGAGKGGTIKAITGRVSPRSFRLSPKRTDRLPMKRRDSLTNPRIRAVPLRVKRIAGELQHAKGVLSP